MKLACCKWKLLALASSLGLASSFVVYRNQIRKPSPEAAQPVFLPGSKSDEEARHISDGVNGGLAPQP